jgi:aspartate-semialdehyde dehydrogenase
MIEDVTAMTEGTATVAVVGATGLVGQEILTVLAERKFPARTVRALASPNSAGARVPYAEQQLRVDVLTDDALADADIVFFCAGADVSERYARAAAEAGALAIDTSPRFVADLDVPLIAPEVNVGVLGDEAPLRLVAVAGGAAAALAPVLKPIADAAGLRSVAVSTYESVSEMGQQGVTDLSEQTVGLLNGQPAGPEELGQRVAFNCIPIVGAIGPEGHSTTERVAVMGVRRLLGRPELPLAVTAVRVPVFFGLGVSATVETEQPFDIEAIRVALRTAAGLILAEAEDTPYAALLEVVGSDATHVARLRVDPERPTQLSFWAAVDNIRKTGAVNAVSIAERLFRADAD